LRRPAALEAAWELRFGPGNRFQSLLSDARQQIREGHGISHEEFWQEVATGEEMAEAAHEER
jgi:hypothetical protein